MTIEEILAEDRITFERIINSPETPHLSAGLVLWFNSIVSSYVVGKWGGTTTIVTRVNAFMGLLLEHDVAASVKGHVLRSTIAGKDMYTNWDKLYESVKPLQHQLCPDDVIDPTSLDLPTADVLTQLETLCSDYMTWLDRMRDLTPTADAKNHPRRDQLRERDAIRLQINNLATPKVILQLVKLAQEKRGES